MDQFDNLLGIEVLESLQPSGRTSSQENGALKISVMNSWFSALLLRVSGPYTLRLELPFSFDCIDYVIRQ
jgi:hypothetical protein